MGKSINTFFFVVGWEQRLTTWTAYSFFGLFSLFSLACKK